MSMNDVGIAGSILVLLFRRFWVRFDSFSVFLIVVFTADNWVMEFLSERDLLDRTSPRTSTVLIYFFFLLLPLLLLLQHLLLEHTSQIGLLGWLCLLLFHLLLSRLGEVAVLFNGRGNWGGESISDIGGRVGVRRSRFSGGFCTVCVLFIHHHWRYVRRESCSQRFDHINIWAQALVAELALDLYRTKWVLSQIGHIIRTLNDINVSAGCFFFFVDLFYQYLALAPHFIEVLWGDGIKVKVFCGRLYFFSEAFDINASVYGSILIFLFITDFIRIAIGFYVSVKILLIAYNLTAQGEPEVVIFRLFLKVQQHLIFFWHRWFLDFGWFAFARVAGLRVMVIARGEARVTVFTFCWCWCVSLSSLYMIREE